VGWATGHTAGIKRPARCSWTSLSPPQISSWTAPATISTSLYTYQSVPQQQHVHQHPVLLESSVALYKWKFSLQHLCLLQILKQLFQQYVTRRPSYSLIHLLLCRWKYPRQKTTLLLHLHGFRHLCV
jgi:hypothetical protein